MADALVWKGAEINTAGELVDAMGSLKSADEARAFRDAYRLVTEHADVNLGYCTGYFGSSEAERLREWLDVDHPILGRRTGVSPDEAFAAGVRWAGGRSDG